MRSELVIKSKSLAGTSDLTLLAPIKRGLVSSLESVSHKTRIKRLLQALSTGRSSSQEYALLRPFSDAVERVGKIHSVRVAVIEPEDKLLLAVTFDGSWEAYIRVLWQKVGTLLDIIFCDTEDYVTACDHRFEEWEAWARRVQVETNFFYGTPYMTVADTHYLRETEELQRTCPFGHGSSVKKAQADDVDATRLHVVSAEEKAWRDAAKTTGKASLEALKQGLEALAALYRLTDLYLPSTDDGLYFRRAVRDLLLEFVVLLENDEVPQDVQKLARWRFEKQLAWLQEPLPPPTNPLRVGPPLPTSYPKFDRDDVQGGIITGYEGATHGCVLLLAIEDRAQAMPFFKRLIKEVTRENSLPLDAHSLPAVNIAITYEGFRAAGLTERELELLPLDFREGMEARAGMLGDVWTNHPRRWHLPKPHPPASQKVELSAVHMVLQLRCIQADYANDWCDLGGKDSHGRLHPLKESVDTWCAAAAGSGLRVLSLQTTQRYYQASPQGRRSVEHFGFADADSDPTVDPRKPGHVYRNQIHLGEILFGHENEADWPPDPQQSADPAAVRERLKWLHNGSFLVIRKLSQDVPGLYAAASSVKGMPAEDVLAKMMGRKLDGTPLAHPGTDGPHNDFDYSGDPDGAACPFHSHIRRANPRHTSQELHELPGRRTPRIVRRGMSYGPRVDGTGAPLDAERGLLFMAYNASLGEQFEVIQRWISGGNSSGGYSGQSDPFCGVPRNGERRHFRFEKHDANGHPEAVSVTLDGSEESLGDRMPFVSLEWGLYAFAPSISTLVRLRDRLAQHAAPPDVLWSSADGERCIQALLAMEGAHSREQLIEAWKTALEDPVEHEKFRSAGIWAAIRANHAGVLRTPYGVLVASRELVMQVFSDTGRYSVRGYFDRLTRSIGEIYLGRDDDETYQQLSRETNAAIQSVSKAEAFALARRLTKDVMAEFIGRAKFLPNPAATDEWELILDLKEPIDKVLGCLCQWWFGLPEETDHIKLEGARWDADPHVALYPGHFTAPSRFVFQPRPGRSAEAYGCDYGAIVSSAFLRFVKVPASEKGAWTRLAPDGATPAPIGEAIWQAFGGSSPNHEQLARTLVGTMMGLLPTLDGNLRRSLHEWLFDGSFWSLRSQWLARPASERTMADAEKVLREPLVRSMQLRPSPELAWRTAVHPHRLGEVDIQSGDIVVLSIVSAAQQCLAAADPDVSPLFGGNRSLDKHPTHACPGYAAAMGGLLGFMTALLEIEEEMRPSAVPMALTFSGPFGQRIKPAPRAMPKPVSTAKQGQQPLGGPAPGGTDGNSLPVGACPPNPQTTRLVIGLGDSWFHYFAFDMFDVFGDSGDFEALSLAEEGVGLLNHTAFEAQLQRLALALVNKKREGKEPAAIMLSAGGNDVVTPTLAELLRPYQPDQDPLIEPHVEMLIDMVMRWAVEDIITAVIALCRKHLGHTVPVLLHGYDFPYPTGLGPFESPFSAWLKPDFDARGYTDPAQCADTMRRLIQRLNDMLLDVSLDPAFQGIVTAVDLTETLCEKDWSNELHPTREGFVVLAAKLAAAIPQ